MEEHENNKDIMANGITMEEFHIIRFALHIAMRVDSHYEILLLSDVEQVARLIEKIDKILEK